LSGQTSGLLNILLISVFINLIICSVAAALAADQSLWCAISVKAHFCLNRMVAEKEKNPSYFPPRVPIVSFLQN
jgi:hypothetical protein